MQQLTVNHRTTYRYRKPVQFGVHRLMFRPRDSHDLRVLDAVIAIEPNAKLRWIFDVFGNSVAIAEFEGPSDTLVLESRIEIERHQAADLNLAIEPYARTIPFSYPVRETADLGRTIERHYSDPERLVTEWTRRYLQLQNGGTDTERFLLSVTSGIKEQFSYEVRHEPGVQDPVETLQKQSGTCRDYALFMMEVVRSVGLAARFVSGYLYDPALDGDESETVGAGATHAWVQVYLPGAGWREFDPTNGQVGGQNLVPVAVAREPAQAIPVSGTFTGDASDLIDMSVEVSVRAAGLLRAVA